MNNLEEALRSVSSPKKWQLPEKGPDPVAAAMEQLANAILTTQRAQSGEMAKAIENFNQAQEQSAATFVKVAKENHASVTRLIDKIAKVAEGNTQDTAAAIGNLVAELRVTHQAASRDVLGALNRPVQKMIGVKFHREEWTGNGMTLPLLTYAEPIYE